MKVRIPGNKPASRKRAKKDAVEISIDITDENVFSRCVKCGEEVAVNLADILPQSDMNRTAVLCEDCAKDGRPET